MDFLKLPPEIMETIFLKLDTQALAACALADKHLVKVIYSAHFLDAYCRKTLSCPWITARDIEELEIALPFQFWFLVYSTLKIEEIHGKILLPNKLLTKIGTFRDMFIMWLICGHRSSYIDSYALMNVLYPLPQTVEEVFEPHNRPKQVVIDTLLKVFYSFPEIMHISCGNLTLFQMQRCPPRDLALCGVYEQYIRPSLPKQFTLLHSVEIVSATCPAGHPTVILLIAEECWVLWLGTISIDIEDTTVISKLFQQTFDHSIPVTRIQDRAHSAVEKLNNLIYNTERSHLSINPLSVPSIPSPVISGENSDIASLVISVAQESSRSLQKKFLSIYQSSCQSLVENFEDLGDNEKEIIVKNLNTKIASQSQLDDYILKSLETDVTDVRLYSNSRFAFVVYKNILERLACLFRNETHSFIEHSFGHMFLCGCIGPCVPTKNNNNVETKIEKCISTSMSDGLYSPVMWPPHVLSAACQIVPVLCDILKIDINLTLQGSFKAALPFNLLCQVAEKLFVSGLMLTNRPPNKPRCPPLLKQVRLFFVDALEQ